MIKNIRKEKNKNKNKIQKTTRKRKEEYDIQEKGVNEYNNITCLLYTSPSPRDKRQSRMPSSA